MTLVTFNKAVRALQDSDRIVIQDKNSGDSVVATFVGWENEGDPESDFVVGAEGWGDVYIPHAQKTIREGNVLKPRDCCVVLEMYKKMK